MINQQFWKTEDFELIRKAISLGDLANIAKIVLHRMQYAGREISIICGPVSTGGLGTEHQNLNLFKCAIIMADAMGEFIFDQTVFFGHIGRLAKKSNGEYNTDILTGFFEPVFRSGYINKALFLHRWETSVGATWEHNLCKELGVRILPYPDTWLPKNFLGY